MFIIMDIGSTTTKGLLIENRDPSWKFLSQADCYTTVEKPEEDVNIGINNCLKLLSAKSGEKLLDEKGNCLQPLLVTSSAGGGLQILVVGLTGNDTGKTAEVAALSAGGVIAGKLTLIDQMLDHEKISLIRKINPDIILFAGGYDLSANPGIYHLADILRIAEPKCRFTPDEKLPLIFCGSKYARKHIKEILKEQYELFITENIKPDVNTFNIEPARRLISNLFKDKVMQKAPGFKALKNRTTEDVLPTPSAVEKILELYFREKKENTLVVDMGGATTDLYAFFQGDYQRTISANIGLSYSLANLIQQVLEKDDFTKISKHLPPSFDLDEVKNYINNKTLKPNSLPKDDSERLLEQVFAVSGFELSWKQHMETHLKIFREDFFDKLYQQDLDNFSKLNPLNLIKKIKGKYYRGKIYNLKNNKDFTLPEVDTIIGSGGVIAYAKSPKEQLYMLAEGFKPWGITKLVVDKPFKISHMGILSCVNQKEALNLFKNLCLEELGYVIAPYGSFNQGIKILEISEDEKASTLSGGEIKYYPQGGNLRIKCLNRARLGQKLTEIELNSSKPILIDCRNRDDFFIDKPLSLAKEFDLFTENQQFINCMEPESPKINLQNQQEIIEAHLPYEGDILVKEGDYVKPGTTLGINYYKPPKNYFYDLKNIAKAYNISNESFMKHLRINKEELVEYNQEIYNAKKVKDFHSSQRVQIKAKARARVTDIYQSGLVYMKEVQDYSKESYSEINIAKHYHCFKSSITNYLKVANGDFVYEGDIIAENISSRSFTAIRSPQSGFIREVNPKTGKIKICYNMEPIITKSIIKARVNYVDKANWKFRLLYSGTKLSGNIGFGKKVYGKAVLYSKNEQENQKNIKDKIVICKEPLSAEVYQDLVESKCKGVIAPSLSINLLSSLIGKDQFNLFNLAEELFPVSIIILKGFGNLYFDDDNFSIIKDLAGKELALNTKTQIRAGAIRPEILIND